MVRVHAGSQALEGSRRCLGSPALVCIRAVGTHMRPATRSTHSTEAAVELLIRARDGRFVEPGQPWLRTDDRGITWLDAEVMARYSHAVSSGERHILTLVEALALGKPLEDVGGLMASLDPYHLGLVLAVLRHAGCGSGSTRISSNDGAAEYLG